MVRYFWFTVGFLVLLWILLQVGVFHGWAEVWVSRIVYTAWSMACPLSLVILIWAPGLVRDSTAGWTRFWQRIGARRRDMEDLKRKVAHLEKPHHMALLGNAYFKQGRFRQATDWFHKALEKDPQLLDARYKLGLCHFQSGDFRGAAELLESVCGEKPQYDYGQADLRLAQSQHRLGNRQRSGEVYQSLLRFYPGHPEGSYSFALLQAEEGDVEASRKLMQEVIVAVRHSPPFQRRRNRHWSLKAHWWLWRNG